MPVSLSKENRDRSDRERFETLQLHLQKKLNLEHGNFPMMRYRYACVQ